MNASTVRSLVREISGKKLRFPGRCSRNSLLRSYHQLAHSPTSTDAFNHRILSSSECLRFAESPSAVRHFSEKSEDAKNSDKEEAEAAAPSENEESSEQAKGETEVSETEKLEAKLKDMKDQLLRSLAEQENIRRIAKRDVENARSFAVTSFAKSLLETSDNLSRAMDAVPEELRKDTENHPVLATLYEGIHMTDSGLSKAFNKNGLKKFGESGDKFDPNMHEALFEYPDENMDAGSVGQVMKVGFMLNDRVIRPAEVGVTKKP
mmetsp:Transcript_7158/g.8283  ORF Transcript_7158/g.8283 Transcript_7158/m.8283 type:complete len:264 (-) Transcript_7158:43-834(-)|eukprot:CAMPEP_0204649310 /NCGR_PEP_ID=MMETSP0718-20130828/9411_1 /ASSEMBLY_ACC=CAM_ASM_000674 /TAXON_ID=230516 /ORGANISM="Chaetoceros curvisetus" /LENGTH=263 /DNA_ID=CAMNT_0051672369 /DNA_START=82 /DNA_END=869 /DNA_ORIENTATION=+